MGRHNFVIIDGYPKESREEFDRVGMTHAGVLYSRLLKYYIPDAGYDLFFSSDQGVDLPDDKEIKEYSGVLWPGCNLTIYNHNDERVTKMLGFCKRAYNAGVPQFGSCWGIQLAVAAAGGKVSPNPKGREMGIGRKIMVSDNGRKHPMFRGKPLVFNHFVSHDDEVTGLPEGAELLAGNGFSRVQAVAVKHLNGEFWATQYHPEYNLMEMACLIMAREGKLIELGMFRDHEDVEIYANRMKMLFNEPGRYDLRWQLAIDDDILSDSVRQCEFANWVDYFIKG